MFGAPNLAIVFGMLVLQMMLPAGVSVKIALSDQLPPLLGIIILKLQSQLFQPDLIVHLTQAAMPLQISTQMSLQPLVMILFKDFPMPRLKVLLAVYGS